MLINLFFSTLCKFTITSLQEKKKTNNLKYYYKQNKLKKKLKKEIKNFTYFY